MSSNNSFLVNLLSQLAYSSPFLLAFGVGLILALVRWNNHPRVSGIASAGFVVLILNSVIMTSLRAVMFQQMTTGAWSQTQFSRATMLLGAGQSMVSLAGYSLLVAAIFVGRSVPRRSFPRDIHD